MPEIKQTSAYLTINSKHLDRNFRFKIICSSNALQKTASIYIKRNYFLTNRIVINTGDKVFISLQNNKEDKILIFSGITKSVSTTAHEIHLEAGFNCVEDKVFSETYKDTKLEEVLKELLSKGTDAYSAEFDRMSKILPKLKYEAEGFEREQIIVQGAIALSTKRLLSDKYYYLNLKDELVVLDKPKEGASYIVDDCLYFAKADCIAIFPIPQLEINDTVEYQGNKYIVDSIVYHYLSRAQMILGVRSL